MSDCLWIRLEEYRRIADPLTAEPAEAERCRLLDVLSLYNRINTLSAIHHSGRGWIGASFSIAELMTALYFDVARVGDPAAPDRDYVLLSKGHAAVMQYAVLAGRGILPVEALLRFNQPDGPQAHTDRSTPGIETNTGSLGQTLSKAVGLALGGAHRIFVILGDGELQEGQNYEALMSLHQHGLTQIIPIIDRNGIQSDSETRDIKAIPDLEKVLSGFGMQSVVFNGHDMSAVLKALRTAYSATRPTVLIANTRKAAGVSFMEADHAARRGFAWHGKAPNAEEYRAVLSEWAARPEAKEICSRIQACCIPTAPAEISASAAAEELPPTGTFFSQHLAALAERETALVVLDADLEKACKLTAFSQQRPGQYLEMGIAEQDMAACAGGLALRGKIPVVNTFAAFLRRAFEQAYTNATEHTRVIYAGHYAGLSYFTDGKSHQCTGDVAMMRSIPGMRVIYPAFNEEIPQILSWYLSRPQEGPLYLRLHAKPCRTSAASHPGSPFEPDRGLFLRRNGSRCCVLTSGPHMTQYCVAAVDALSGKNRAIDLCTVSPLSHLCPDWVARLATTYERLIVAEELFETGGLLDELNRALAQARGMGLSANQPLFFHRAVRGLPFSTLDPEGLYNHFQLTPQHLIPWLSALAL